jgi:hypothetical protein
VVVLDHEHVGMRVQDPPERRGAVGVDAGAGRVLCARCAHHRPCAVLEGRLQRDGVHAPLVDADADGTEAHRGHDAGACHVAGILECDRIAPDKSGAQQSLDRVERAVRHRQAVGLVDVAGEEIAGALAQRRQHRGRPIQRRVVADRGERRP